MTFSVIGMVGQMYTDKILKCYNPLVRHHTRVLKKCSIYSVQYPQEASHGGHYSSTILN